MYQVVAPLVYLRVPDVAGSLVSYTFYKGALVPTGVDPECLRRHLDEGMVVELEVPDVVDEDAPVRRGRPRKSE